MFFKKKNYDFIAIGDLITDAFIDLSDAWVEDDNPEKKQELCMHFGEKIPYKHIDIIPAVGNSPNAAVAAHRLGISSALVSDCGNDMYGREQLQSLKKEGLSKPFIYACDRSQRIPIASTISKFIISCANHAKSQPNLLARAWFL